MAQQQRASLLHVSRQVRAALEAKQPVVALESTVVAHGLPYPANVETACQMEAAVREHGAVPATIAVLHGQLHVGLTESELEFLGTARNIRKVSRRDLPVVVAQQSDGATTAAATATIAAWAGIGVFATGGIGGVHRDAPFDVSNDLPTLASVPVPVESWPLVASTYTAAAWAVGASATANKKAAAIRLPVTRAFRDLLFGILGFIVFCLKIIILL